jgi:hypothetical protein
LCSNCNQIGHNLRTCPELDPFAAKVRVARNSRNKALRRCGICGSMTHNKRTCPL